MTDDEYRLCIDKSQVYDVAKNTLLEKAIKLSDKFGNEVYLKREDLQIVHSFKIRGAYAKMRSLSEAELKRGVITASAGNHAQGVAYSALRLGTTATIVMPLITPQLKVDEVRKYGGNIILHGKTFSDSAAYAIELANKEGVTYIPPYDDPMVIAGQGTVAREILMALPEVDEIYVPIGGGGFAAGVSVYVKNVKPNVKVYGVEPDDSDCMYQSIQADRIVSIENPSHFADGVCVKQPGVETFRICKKHLDGIVRVTKAEICSAIGDVFEETRVVCEPSGALAVAAVKKRSANEGKRCVAIISGANLNFSSLATIVVNAIIMQLRDEIVADGKVDIGETEMLLSKIHPFLRMSHQMTALSAAVNDARSDGVISDGESEYIIKLLNGILNDIQ